MPLIESADEFGFGPKGIILRKLIDGPVQLFVYREDDNKARFFIGETGTMPEELINKILKADNPNGFKKIEAYKSQLSSLRDLGHDYRSSDYNDHKHQLRWCVGDFSSTLSRTKSLFLVYPLD